MVWLFFSSKNLNEIVAEYSPEGRESSVCHYLILKLTYFLLVLLLSC